jgi:benzoylformate decarboxylase
MNRITGRSAFLSLLKDEGISHMFGNPGTTELPIMHALTEHPDMTYVLGLQESVVVAMADGYSRASGQLVACNVHVAPGLGNAMGALYNAKFTGTPLILTAGQQEQGHGLTEPMLYDPLVPIAQPLVKWAVEVTRLEDLPRIVRRAAKVALTPPTGPVFLSLPGDVLNDEAGLELGNRTRVDAAARPSDAALDALAGRLLEAKRPAILCGNEIVTSDALAEAAEFAETLGAPVYQQTVAYGAHFLSEHPCFQGALSRDQKQVRAALDAYDLLVVVGADVLRMSVWNEVDPLPTGLAVVQIGQRDWEMGKNYPTEQALRADVGETLRALIPVLRAKGGSGLEGRAQAACTAIGDDNWSTRRQALRGELEGAAGATPIDPDWLMMRIVDALPKDAIVVDEGVTATRNLGRLLPFRDRYGYHALASGGIGWGIAAAVGVQVAQPDRPVLAVIGDGSAMYSIQALWTAANLNIPITYVIANNKGYRILRQRLMAFHGNDQFIGMDFRQPEIDFTGLARSLGMQAVRVEAPDDVAPALDAALANPGPNLIDVAVEDGPGG